MIFPRLKAAFLGAVLGLYTLPPLAHADTVVRLDTALGSMTFQLYDTAKPVTVANFLNYIRTNSYAGTFAHRLVSGFVLQGGSYTYGSGLTAISANAPIINEAGPFPQYSSLKGTLAMAKLGGDPNSATSGWFLNLGDNSANLDNQNGGFTVFGAVLSGASVMDAFNAFTDDTALDPSTVVGSDLIVNYGSPLDSLPIYNMTLDGAQISDLVYTNWTIVSPSLLTAAKVKGSHGQAVLKGSASADTARIEVQPGGGGFKKVKGLVSHWKFTARGLKKGNYKFKIRSIFMNGQKLVTTVRVVVKS